MIPNDPLMADNAAIQAQLGAAFGTELPTQTSLDREAPDPTESRRALVAQMGKQVQTAREYWTTNAFNQMRRDMRFAAGDQWPRDLALPGDENFLDDHDNRYVANITLRHIQSRTASIYGKNPKIVAHRKKRLLSRLWDGSSQTLQAAMQAAQADPLNPTPQMIIQDALQTMQQNQQADAMARTLELMFEHEVDEQPVPFKVQMKGVVRRGLTTSVGYVKLGYQIVMKRNPEVDAQIENYSQQLATVERLSADIADGEIEQNDAQAEQLRLTLQSLAEQENIVTREGLTFTFPHSTAIIPDLNCQSLRGFVGAEWVAEEYFLTADKIKEIYSKDVKSAGGGHGADNAGQPRDYLRSSEGTFSADQRGASTSADTYHCVWEIYSRIDGMVYVVCDGYPDFLVEPSAPDVSLERFYPWFAFVVNEVYCENKLFPPSDVFLMRDMQREINRARQGLREHRRAAIPKTFVRKGALSTSDKEALESPLPHTVVELDALQPNEDIGKVLQAHAGPQIDPRLYDTNAAYEDHLRTLGQQEANLGGTSGATATEASIAEGSRVSSVSAVVDDLDEFLSEIARAAGQILLMKCSKEKVTETVGPGAVWPELRREQIAREIFLDIEAASTGRPNKAQEIQNAQAVFPLLMQIPGVSPEFLAKELLRRMDDRLDVTDAFAPGVPSIMMMNQANAATQGGAAAPGSAGRAQDPANDPNAQGGQGANNASTTEPPQINAAPRQPNPVGRPPMVALPA
jgi:hypothetical protein